MYSPNNAAYLGNEMHLNLHVLLLLEGDMLLMLLDPPLVVILVCLFFVDLAWLKCQLCTRAVCLLVVLHGEFVLV